MTVLLAITIGTLFAAAVHQLLRRSPFSLVLGLVLLGHATNLWLFTSGGVVEGVVPIAPPGADWPPAGHADSLPQALTLTAIVIGFAVVAFTAVLVARATDALDTDDLDHLGGEP